MARKRKVPTRKRRALRWLTVLAALVVLSAVLDIYYLFPSQALAYLDSREGLTDTETVHSTWDGLRRLYLRRCDDGFYYTHLVFYPLSSGWYPRKFMFFADQDSPPFWGAFIHSERGEARMDLFGFVPEGEEPPVFSIRTTKYDTNGATVSMTETDRFTPQADIPGEGGRYCLMTRRYPCPNFSSIDIYVQQEDGTWKELDRQSNSSRGP